MAPLDRTKNRKNPPLCIEQQGTAGVSKQRIHALLDCITLSAFLYVYVMHTYGIHTAISLYVLSCNSLEKVIHLALLGKKVYIITVEYVLYISYTKV